LSDPASSPIPLSPPSGPGARRDGLTQTENTALAEYFKQLDNRFNVNKQINEALQSTDKEIQKTAIVTRELISNTSDMTVKLRSLQSLLTAYSERDKVQQEQQRRFTVENAFNTDALLEGTQSLNDFIKRSSKDYLVNVTNQEKQLERTRKIDEAQIGILDKLDEDLKFARGKQKLADVVTDKFGILGKLFDPMKRQGKMEEAAIGRQKQGVSQFFEGERTKATAMDLGNSDTVNAVNAVSDFNRSNRQLEFQPVDEAGIAAAIAARSGGTPGEAGLGGLSEFPKPSGGPSAPGGADQQAAKGIKNDDGKPIKVSVIGRKGKKSPSDDDILDPQSSGGEIAIWHVNALVQKLKDNGLFKKDKKEDSGGGLFGMLSGLAGGGIGAGIGAGLKGLAGGLSALGDPKVLLGVLALIGIGAAIVLIGFGVMLMAPVLIKLLDVIQNVLIKAIEKLPAIIEAIGNVIVKVISAIGDVIVKVIAGVAAGIKDVIGPIAENIKMIFNTIGDIVIKVISGIGDNVIKIFKGIADAIKTAAKPVADAISSVVRVVGEEFRKTIDTVINGVLKIANLDALHILAVAGAITTLGGALIGFGATSAGGGLVSGLANGILGFFSQDPVSKFKAFADIGAPLKMAAEAIDLLVKALGSLITLDLSKAGDKMKTVAEAIKNSGLADLLGKMSGTIAGSVVTQMKESSVKDAYITDDGTIIRKDPKDKILFFQDSNSIEVHKNKSQKDENRSGNLQANDTMIELLRSILYELKGANNKPGPKTDILGGKNLLLGRG